MCQVADGKCMQHLELGRVQSVQVADAKYVQGESSVSFATRT